MMIPLESKEVSFHSIILPFPSIADLQLGNRMKLLHNQSEHNLSSVIAVAHPF